MKRKLFWLAVVLLAAAVYFGLLVTVGDQYLHVDLSLGLPVVARTLIAFHVRRLIQNRMAPSGKPIWSVSGP